MSRTSTLAAFRVPVTGASQALHAYARLFAGQYARLALAGLVYLAKHSPAVLLPLIIGTTVDLLVRHAPPVQLAVCALATALLIAQNLPGHRLYVHLLDPVVQRVQAALREALAKRLQVLALPWWWRQSPAALQTRLLRDVEAVSRLTIVLADGVLGCGSGIVVALAVTAWRAPQFLWLFLVTVPMASALVWSAQQRTATAPYEHPIAADAQGDGAAEMTHRMPHTNAHGREPVQALAGRDFDDAARTGLALDLAPGRVGALGWVGFQGLNALCLFVAAADYLLAAAPLTLGDVVLLTAFFGTLTHSVLGLAAMVPQVRRGIEAVRSIDELMRGAPVEPAGHALPPWHLGLRIEQVSHRAEGRAGIEAVTLELPPGHTVALVGPSGAGKTTLAMLACGLLRPQHGHITVDGLPLEALDPHAWRRHVGWVPQDGLLGDGSVRDNLIFGLGAVDELRLRQVLADTGCAGFVARLPQGLETPLDVHGHRLSGDERQRLALARALLREPRLLVLDEPTSALDRESERLVLHALTAQHGQRTTLVIARRLSAVVEADTIVVMDAGQVVDQGSHDELLARSALYQRLWAADEPGPATNAGAVVVQPGPAGAEGRSA